MGSRKRRCLNNASGQFMIGRVLGSSHTLAMLLATNGRSDTQVRKYTVLAKRLKVGKSEYFHEKICFSSSSILVQYLSTGSVSKIH